MSTKINILLSIILLIATGLRIVLKNTNIQIDSGFYNEQTGLVYLFTGLLLVILIVAITLPKFARSALDKSVNFSVFTAIATLITGGFMAASLVTMFEIGNLLNNLSTLLLAISVFSMILIGITYLRGITKVESNTQKLLFLMPTIWGITVALQLFSSYTEVLSNSDQWLHIFGITLFMLCIFTQAKYLCGEQTKKVYIANICYGFGCAIFLIPFAVSNLSTIVLGNFGLLNLSVSSLLMLLFMGIQCFLVSIDFIRADKRLFL